MKISIRAAISADLQELCRLYHAFHEFHVQGVPDRLISLGSYEGYDRAELERSLQEISCRPDAVLFVAVVSGELVGVAEVYLREDDPNNPVKAHRKYVYLQSLMVSHHARRLGIGRELMDKVHQWARSQGASEVRLETWEFPEGPQHFYEVMGYRTLRRTLVNELDK